MGYSTGEQLWGSVKRVEGGGSIPGGTQPPCPSGRALPPINSLSGIDFSDRINRIYKIKQPLTKT